MADGTEYRAGRRFDIPAPAYIAWGRFGALAGNKKLCI